MDAYINLAKQAIAHFLENGKIMSLPQDLPQEFYQKRAGVFVSLHAKDGELRGCIGTMTPTQPNLGTEIIANAIAACSRDPRFFPLTKEELADLEIFVDILSAPEQIPDLTNHDPKKYGLIAKADSRTGLLLPDLEGIDTAKQQLKIVLQKGGIREDEEYTMFRFSVERHH